MRRNDEGEVSRKDGEGRVRYVRVVGSERGFEYVREVFWFGEASLRRNKGMFGHFEGDSPSRLSEYLLIHRVLQGVP